MRKSNWTPSIVPNSDDQNVYLVVDDFGRHGRAWRETDVENTDLETVILDMLEGQFKTLSGSSRSIPPKSGRKTCRPMSPTNCDSAAIFKPVTFHSSCRTSSTTTKAGTATSSCLCRCVLSDQ
jgi:hypothetical protein